MAQVQAETFVRAVGAVRTRRSSGLMSGLVPTVREWLGGCVLDHLGLAPAELLDGVTVVVTYNRDVQDAVCDALRLVYRAMLASPTNDASHHDGNVTILEPGAPEADYDGALNVGAPVIWVVQGLDQLRPAGTRATADRVVKLGLPLAADVVSDLVSAVTGTDTQVPDVIAVGLTPVEVLRCVRVASTADACLERMEAMLRAGEPPKPEPEPTKAAAAAPSKGDVVQRLSKMTGFGEAQSWGVRLALDLAAYAEGTLPWRDVDRGLLLSGPPGGGKTTFARALALECEVDLVVTTYNEWSSLGGTGDSMSKGMTKLFDTWRKKAEKGPFILFVDEIDSMGPRGGAAHNESWFAPLINSWLAFLDGAVPRDGIVVVAATNFPDRVDAGMLRPGRLDRHIELPMPDVAALVGMVRAHLGDEAAMPREDLAEAARAVRGKSPAEVAQLCREARRIARWCGRRVCASDLTEVVGMQRRDVRAEDARLVAVHEAGHAVAGAVLMADQLTCVDVDAGRTSFLLRPYATRSAVEDRIVTTLAARAAEEVLLGDVTTGATQDLRDVTAAAVGMYAAWGMGAAGLVHVEPDAALRDPRIAAAVRGTLDAAYVRALALVRTNRAAVDRVARALVERRYLDRDEVLALVRGDAVPTPPGRSMERGNRLLRATGPTV